MEANQLPLLPTSPPWFDRWMRQVQSNLAIYARQPVLYARDQDGVQWHVENPWYEEGQ